MSFPSNPTDLQMFGNYYYDLAVGAWRPNYGRFPSKAFEEPQDLVLDGNNFRQSTIVCKNLTTTANTTVRARSIWVWGDATISHSITFKPVISWYERSGAITGPHVYIPGRNGPYNGRGGQGCLGGAKAGNNGFSGGGGSAWHAGGSGRDGAGGAAGGDFPEYSFGGPGGSTSRESGGGGAGPGAAGGNPNPTSGDVSLTEGGELTFIIVRGTLLIESGGSLKTPGGTSGAIYYSNTARASGASGGGVIIVVALSDYQNDGIISAPGGSTTLYRSAGGGGGHAEVYAPTNNFGSVTAPGGTGPDGNGGAGTTATQDTTGFAQKILVDPDALLHDGFWFRYLQGHYSY